MELYSISANNLSNGYYYPYPVTCGSYDSSNANHVKLYNIALYSEASNGGYTSQSSLETGVSSTFKYGYVFSIDLSGLFSSISLVYEDDSSTDSRNHYMNPDTGVLYFYTASANNKRTFVIYGTLK